MTEQTIVHDPDWCVSHQQIECIPEGYEDPTPYIRCQGCNHLYFQAHHLLAAWREKVGTEPPHPDDIPDCLECGHPFEDY